MSIATRITSITNHLEKDYQALESVVGKVSVNKNIENIAPLLDNLWEDLPKTTGSGTNPSISDTRAGKMKLSLKGNTSQTGTPTPDNPIPVNVVSGDNEVVVCGKNICYKTTLGNNAANLWLFTDSAFLEQTFSISFTTNVALSNNSVYLKVDRVDYGVIGNVTADVNSRATVTITLSNVNYNAVKNGKEVILQIYKGGATFTIPNDSMIKNGSDTTYEPYQSSTYPIHLGTYELCKIGTYQDKFIRNSGKNLLQITTFNDNTTTKTINGITATINSDGTISMSGIASANAIFYLTKNDFTLSGAFYYLCNSPSANARIELQCKVDGATLYLNDYGTGNKRTANDSFVFDSLYIVVNNGTNVNGVIFEPMIALGTIVEPYEPYGNGDWYKEGKIGKVVLDGSESGTWGVGSEGDTTDGKTFYHSFISSWNMKVLTYSEATTKDDIFALSNNFNGYAYKNLNVSPKKLNFVSIGVNAIVFNISNSENVSTGAEFATWLSSHNTTIYYVLETPTYTKIEGTLKDELEAVWRAYSYKGQTNISQINNDLPFELSITALEG